MYGGFEPKLEQEGDFEQLVCRAATKLHWVSAKVNFINRSKESLKLMPFIKTKINNCW